MIPRSIWRWMTLGIKKGKRLQLFGALIGICVAVVSLFYFFHAEKAEAEKRMVEIVNYVKVQCSTYTHYNESTESKSLLRAIESARQMSTNIKTEKENGGHLSREFLKENLQTLWVDGIIVLNAEGKTDCEYSTNEPLANEITEYLQKTLSWILPDMKKDLIQNGLPWKTGHILTLQPVPEKMHQVSWQSTIIHLPNLPETIL